VKHPPRNLTSEILGIVNELQTRQSLNCRDFNVKDYAACFERHPGDHEMWCDGCLVAVIAAWAATHVEEVHTP